MERHFSDQPSARAATINALGPIAADSRRRERNSGHRSGCAARFAASSAACWAHARRKFYDLYEAHKSPIAKEALDRIAALYAIEKEIRGRPPDERAAEAPADNVNLAVDYPYSCVVACSWHRAAGSEWSRR